jgi:peroxiredoxin Q/BCP
MEMPKVNDQAPEFEGIADNGEKVKLSDFKGKIVVLYFFPKANTPGCTREGIDFSSKIEEFKRNNAVVIGVSSDSVSSQRSFKMKYNFSHILIADKELEIIKKYGVLSDSGKTAKRVTFLIDEKGIIRCIWDKVNVNGHAEDVLRKIKEIKGD